MESSEDLASITAQQRATMARETIEGPGSSPPEQHSAEISAHPEMGYAIHMDKPRHDPANP